MKKIILAAITATMLLSSSAFAATQKPTTLDNSKVVSNLTQDSTIHLNGQDPRGW